MPPALWTHKNLTWRRTHESTPPNASDHFCTMSDRRTAPDNPTINTTEWKEWCNNTTPPTETIGTSIKSTPAVFPGLAPPTLNIGSLATGSTTPRLRIENKCRRLHQQVKQSQRPFGRRTPDRYPTRWLTCQGHLIATKCVLRALPCVTQQRQYSCSMRPMVARLILACHGHRTKYRRQSLGAPMSPPWYQTRWPNSIRK
jgi:hypothetical protein